LSPSVTDGHIDLLPPQVDQPHAGADAHLDARMRLLKRRQPRHEPLCSQRDGGADRQYVVVLATPQTIHRAAQILERGSDRGQQLLGLARQCQRPVAADEERGAELVFQATDLMADGGLGDVQFRRGQREAQVPRGGFEHQEPIQ